METKTVPASGKKNGETLKITDSRTGKNYEVPIENETIKASDLRQIKVKSEDFGMMAYDPAFMNTASCKSKITFIDGFHETEERNSPRISIKISLSVLSDFRV